MRMLPPVCERAAAPVLLAVLLLAAQGAEPALPTGAKWRVRLLAPLSTGFSRKGDMVSTRVLAPAAFQGAILEGVIRDLKAGGDSAGASSIQFDFLTLDAGDKALPVSAALVDALNSRGEPGVDDKGSVWNPAHRASARNSQGCSPAARPQLFASRADPLTCRLRRVASLSCNYSCGKAPEVRQGIENSVSANSRPFCRQAGKMGRKGCCWGLPSLPSWFLSENRGNGARIYTASRRHGSCCRRHNNEEK